LSGTRPAGTTPLGLEMPAIIHQITERSTRLGYRLPCRPAISTTAGREHSDRQLARAGFGGTALKARKALRGNSLKARVMKKADHRELRLLRPSRERPRRCAPKSRDELPPSRGSLSRFGLQGTWGVVGPNQSDTRQNKRPMMLGVNAAPMMYSMACSYVVPDRPLGHAKALVWSIGRTHPAECEGGHTGGVINCPLRICP
jgi:hypothetical protein